MSILEDHEQPLVDVMPLSLQRIESEWQKEVMATKRERGNQNYIYAILLLFLPS